MNARLGDLTVALLKTLTPVAEAMTFLPNVGNY
jgi:hypothetical protein